MKLLFRTTAHSCLTLANMIMIGIMLETAVTTARTTITLTRQILMEMGKEMPVPLILMEMVRMLDLQVEDHSNALTLVIKHQGDHIAQPVYTGCSVQPSSWFHSSAFPAPLLPGFFSSIFPIPFPK